jgi:AmmeMemoRadiSam system protein A/AmmeMemoRadiSam system protein B
MSQTSLVFAGIAPHPPIMVPEVGREAAEQVRGSIEAMQELTRRIIESGAETLILISPHAPLEARSFVAYVDAQLYGDFANFRAPETKIEIPLDRELLEAIASAAAEQSFEVVGIQGYELDHGTAVPLYFILRNGWHGRVVALGYNFLSDEDHLRFGACIKRAVDTLARPVAFIASGDLSHRLKPDAPAGYFKDAHFFDEEIIESLRACEPARIVNIDQKLRKAAGECGYRSMLVAFGATQEIEPACEVLHYEAPFGVGYLVAQLTGKARASVEEQRTTQTSETEPELESGVKQMNKPENNESPEQFVEDEEGAKRLDESEAENFIENEDGAELPALARRTIETFVREQRVIDAPSRASTLLKQRAACFVSIKTLDGDLRGCIGTIEPARNTLAEELIANAISAATRDPRFPPVAARELPNLRYSVDVLSAPEPTEFSELDPAIYGVIVEDESGSRRGLLLPDLEGVETATQQVEIAARKAGIKGGVPLKLFRFRVHRYGETTP